MRTASTLRLATCCLAALLAPGPARAGYLLTSPVDTPADVTQINPATDLPNSYAGFTAFTTAANQVGTLVTTDCAAATGTLTQAALGDGVAVTLTGAKADANSLVTSGVVSSNPNVADGFRVTSTTPTFLRLTPDVTTITPAGATASFTFANPVQGFGVYLTGLGTAPGMFQLKVYDHGPTADPSTFVLSAVPPAAVVAAGGVQYLSFLDPVGSSFSRVDFQMTGYSTTSRDIVSFDGLSFVTANVVPEPPPAALLTVGALTLLVARRVVRASRTSAFPPLGGGIEGGP